MSRTKPRKIRHLRGRKTGFGSHKKHRGGGSRGGRGLAGLHKYKWSWTVTKEPDHFKKPSMKPKPKTLSVINLWQLSEMAVKSNLKEIDLPNYKVLSAGKIKVPLTIKAALFSAEASKKIESAGGKAVQMVKKQEKPKEEKK